MRHLDKITNVLDDPRIGRNPITDEPQFVGFGETIREPRGGAIAVYRECRVTTERGGVVRVKNMREGTEEHMTLDEFEERFAYNGD